MTRSCGAAWRQRSCRFWRRSTSTRPRAEGFEAVPTTGPLGTCANPSNCFCCCFHSWLEPTLAIGSEASDLTGLRRDRLGGSRVRHLQTQVGFGLEEDLHRLGRALEVSRARSVLDLRHAGPFGPLKTQTTCWSEPGGSEKKPARFEDFFFLPFSPRGTWPGWRCRIRRWRRGCRAWCARSSGAASTRPARQGTGGVKVHDLMASDALLPLMLFYGEVMVSTKRHLPASGAVGPWGHGRCPTGKHVR